MSCLVFCMVIAQQAFCWKWISVAKISKYGQNEYSQALKASYTFQPLMGFWGKLMLTYTLSNHFGTPGENWLLINCIIWIISMDQLTAVKTRYPLTSITWPYRGLRCWPIEVEYFFEVIRWQVTSFPVIAGSSLFFSKVKWNMLCLCHYRRGRPFLAKVTL